jgi:methylmalonyl-CoA mutase
MIEKELTLGADFPPVDYDRWKASVEAELKGAPFEKKLVTRTIEGTDVRPLYTAADWPSDGDCSGFPGSIPLTRGSQALGHAVDGWDVRQEHLHPDPAEANRAILDDLEHGVTSVHLNFDAAACAGLDADAREAAELCGRDGVMAYDLGDLDRVLEGVQLAIAPVSLDAGAAFLPASALLAALLRRRKVEAVAVRCAFNADPLGALMSEGQLLAPLEVALAQMADLAAWTAANYPNATAVGVDTGAYHHAGATTTQDLAFAVATAVEYLRAMTGAGLDVDAAARQVAFSMSLGCRFFHAIAKVRALRTMWAKVVTASGGSEATARSARIRVRTSRRVLTRRDPWVNLLRSTVCCFAGAVGGADSITTAPLDAAIGPGDEFSLRLARNTQTILMEESHLNRVIDPAGGSWFLECLTEQFAEKAWALFREIEGQGSMIRAATEGWVAEQVGAVESARERDLATRKQVVTGVSEHPDASERPLERSAPDRARLRVEASSRLMAWRRDNPCVPALAALTRAAEARSDAPGALAEAAVQAAEAGATVGQMGAALTSALNGAQPVRVEPLAVRTFAAAFEELRDACDRHEARTGARLAVFLANMGTPADFIARSTYALNFFQAGGSRAINNDGFADPAAAAEAFAGSGAKVAVICSSDKKYATVVEGTAPRLKAAGARTVVLAGNPGADEAKYRAAGVDRFIFVRCDVLGTLHELLREEGVLS